MENTATVQTPRQFGWRWWYTIAVIGVAVLLWRDDLSALVILIPLTWGVFFIPTWIIISIVRRFRKSVPPPSTVQPAKT
jgi:hypothetical protein